MRLLVISHTPHYRRGDVVVGWSATIREIDALATLFSSVVHIAPLHPEPAPGSSMAYQSSRVRYCPVQPAGGERLTDKLGIPFRFPGYVWTILRECRSADAVHIRAPANISLAAMVALSFVREPRRRWAKYAGDWSRTRREPWSYRFQRAWLAWDWLRAHVTVNGIPPVSIPHVHPFLNPCLTAAELKEGAAVAARKELVAPIRLLFVGRLEAGKGPGICVDIAKCLATRGHSVILDLVGEGPERPALERQVAGLGLGEFVRFRGGLPRSELGGFYRDAHFILLPSATEGWPKVLSEAMAYGAVPMASAVGSIPEFLVRFRTGVAMSSREADVYAARLEDYLQDSARWKRESGLALTAAVEFGYDRFLTAVRRILDLDGANQGRVASTIHP